MTDHIRQQAKPLMAPHLELITGGKIIEADSKLVSTAAMVAEVELTIAQYIEAMLTQLEALSRLLAIEGLANSLEGVRLEARDLVRQLREPA